MPLNTSIITTRLALAPGNQKDNEAQNLIKAATPAELTSLDEEGVLRLFEALATGTFSYHSGRDAVALALLKKHSQFQPVTSTPDEAVRLIKGVRTSSVVQTHLTAKTVTSIYSAEAKRLSRWEKLGADGETIGRGQLGQSAYDDVRKPGNFQSLFKNYMSRVCLSKILADYSAAEKSFCDFTTYSVKVPAKYSKVVAYPLFEDFVVAAYLAILMDISAKPTRSTVDAAKFAVARYHGMFKMVQSVQNTAQDPINWAPVEAGLISGGHTDQVAYVKEVVP